jgi:hypothetical protein
VDGDNRSGQLLVGVIAPLGGRRVAIFLTRNGLVGLDPATGQVHFQRPWRARMAASVNAATPIVNGEIVEARAVPRARLIPPPFRR